MRSLSSRNHLKALDECIPHRLAELNLMPNRCCYSCRVYGRTLTFVATTESLFKKARAINSSGLTLVGVYSSKRQSASEYVGNANATTAAATAIKQVVAAGQETALAIGSLIHESLNKAELASLLFGEGGTYVYVVVAPNRHDLAQLIGRYPQFSAGWRHHAEALRSSLMAIGAFRGITSLLFFLSPEGNESIARLGYAGPSSMLVPSALARSEDLSAGDVKALDASFEFTLGA
jgi:hypothetical protein